MAAGSDSGPSNFVGILIIIFLIIIILITPKDSRNESEKDGAWNWATGTTLSSSDPRTTAPKIAPSAMVTSSNYARQIIVGSGNAAYTYQPYEEYVTLENFGNEPVNLGGWQLKNGKDKRPYYSGDTLQRFSADVAALPALTLGPDERAIITTGRTGVTSPYAIPAVFQENVCTGYLEALPDYSFDPALSLSCPRPSKEYGVEYLDAKCRDIISTISSCKTPVFGPRDSEGETCPECYKGEHLPSYCAAFIKEHYSYGGCLKYHSNDQKFSKRTWRVFLGRPWEMWADRYETIELYDSMGRLVNFVNY